MAAIATSCREATQVAANLLRAGGNAIDAAVAAAWTLAVCEPAESGIGGQTTMLVHFPDGSLRVIDGESSAPASASLSTISRQQQRRGFRACTVPTSPLVLDHAQQQYGRLSRGEALAPAIHYAQDGFPVSRRHRRALKAVLRLPRDSALRDLFLKKGTRRYRVGETFRQPRLAETLSAIAAQGSDVFYRGLLAEAIDRDMACNGGLLSAEDLDAYTRPSETEPLLSSYRGHTVATSPLPTGGLQLLQALRLLETFDLSPGGQNDEAWLETMALATSVILQQRERWPDYPDDALASYQQWMLSDQRAGELAASLRNAQDRPPVVSDREEPGDTTHLCVADANGCVVSLSQSIQSVFGAKVAHRDLGFVYNNYLYTCTRSGPAYRLAGGCRPKSNIAPAIVFRARQEPARVAPGEPPAASEAGPRPRLALGAAGSRRILSSMLQVISRVLDRGYPVDAAIRAPRIHGLSTGSVWLEKPAATESLQSRLATRFARVRLRDGNSRQMGSVQAIEWSRTGVLSAAADPRRSGTSEEIPARVPPTEDTNQLTR